MTIGDIPRRAFAGTDELKTQDQAFLGPGGAARGRLDPGARPGAMVDAPPVRSLIFELPSISSTRAIAAALRAATGRGLTRVPIRPDDLVCREEPIP